MLSRQTTTGLTGYALVSVVDHEGNTLRELPPIRNLWLDQGLDRLANVLIADAFTVAVRGTGQGVIKETPPNTNTYTLAGTTLTRAAGTRNFTLDDVGKLVRTSDGRECVISTYTDATHVDVIGVGTNPLVTYGTPRTVTFYSVQLTGITGEAYARRSGAESASKADGSTSITSGFGQFLPGDVGKSIWVGGTPDDPFSARYKITGFVSDSEITVNRADGPFVGRRWVIYTDQGDADLTPISRTSTYSSVLGENSTTDTAVSGVLTGERVMKRTFIFPPEPEVIEYKATTDAGAYTWNATTVTRTAGARDFVAADVGKYLKFTDGEFCKITARTSSTVVTVDRPPAATITADGGVWLYGGNTYDAVGFSDSDDPEDNLNILVRLDAGGVLVPVYVGGANPELPGQQLKVTYVCKVSVSPVTVTARASAGIVDPTNAMSSNKFGTSVIEGLALSSVDAFGGTVSSFAVLEPAEPGYLGLSPGATALQPLKQPDRSVGVATVAMTAGGYLKGQFTQLYTGQFGINDAIANNWRVAGIYDLDTNAYGYTWLFEANQAKTGQVILGINFRKSWNRDLS